MIDLNKLEAEREKASQDKADLFDFYNDNWDALVAEIRHRYEMDRAARFEERWDF